MSAKVALKLRLLAAVVVANHRERWHLAIPDPLDTAVSCRPVLFSSIRCSRSADKAQSWRGTPGYFAGSCGLEAPKDRVADGVDQPALFPGKAGNFQPRRLSILPNN